MLVVVGLTVAAPSLALAAPTQISGSVTSMAGGQLFGYVQVFDAAGDVVATASTDGAYTLAVAPGTYKVELSAQTQNDCNYQGQFYNDEPFSSNADPVVVTAGSTTSGIDAVLMPLDCQQEFTVSSVGAGTVNVDDVPCTGMCSYEIPTGFVADVIAYPAAGSTFTGWGGACSGTGACDVKMTGTVAYCCDQSVTATFSPATSDITIAAGNPVPEPASGSVPATFTVTLSGPQTSDTVVGYRTIDGTAAAAADDYTSVSNGSVTIPAGATAAQIQVQVDNGSGRMTTETKAFQVQLTSSSGPPISTNEGIATGTITAPGIRGTISDHQGNARAGVRLTLSGTASSGQSVTQTTSSNAAGMYQFFADPGTYTITSAPPSTGSGDSAYEASNCPGTAKLGACADIPLAPGANLTADFKGVLVKIDSIDPTDDSPAGGGPITILGEGYGPAGTADEVVLCPNRTGVVTCERATDVVVDSNSRITATVPQEGAQIIGTDGKAQIFVLDPFGVQSNGAAFMYRVSVRSVKPDRDSPAGGARITIVGEGFGPAGTADEVLFCPNRIGAVKCERATDVVVESDSRLTARVPKELESVLRTHNTALILVRVPPDVESNQLAYFYR